MKRKYAALLLLTLALALPACGKEEDTTAEPTIAAETPTPEPTEEPTPEPTEAPEEDPEEDNADDGDDQDDLGNMDLSDSSAGTDTDYRAPFTGYYGGDYILIKNNQWDDYHLVYSDTTQAYALVDEDVRYFTVIGDEVYYTSRDTDTETYSFWKIAMENGAEPELLLDGTQVCSFSYYNGLIYYDNYDDYYELYCYDPTSGSNERIDTDSLGYYYILGDYIYYERLDDQTFCKMKLDGSDKETLFALSYYNLEHLSSLTAFDVSGYIFFAFTTPGGEMYITTEDGENYELIASGLQDFDLNQDIYCMDGSLYYSAANGMEIHRLDIAEYLLTEGMTEIPDTVICERSFYYFELTDGLIYVELYGGNNEVEVYDCLTGELYNTFDFS
ncbi:MAG: DUF5050 domain-containing protein [Lachnospiraceae bacterium]|nr:DUF5050 domain-containing protein [Lachnospiraceae bacterium]MDE7239014.1 DUF5050 domain-containing protein [Lachnospiraceae bacterium]